MPACDNPQTTESTELPRWAQPDAAPDCSPVGHAVWRACIAELVAVKPGNVGMHGDGHGMRVDDFVRSAAAAAPALSRAGASVGQRVLDAVSATRAAVGCNTNLGICLLCAPLCRAMETRGNDLRARLVLVLDALDVEQTRLVFEAIRIARPAGLGQSPRHDVHGTPAAGLKEVMQQAAERDRIARQYAFGFADIFDIGLPALQSELAQSRGGPGARSAPATYARATAHVYLHFLARFVDTHVLRKLGGDVASLVREEAAALERAVTQRAGQNAGEQGDMQAREERTNSMLLGFDRSLKSRGINPGTCADLTVATVLAHELACLDDECMNVNDANDRRCTPQQRQT